MKLNLTIVSSKHLLLPIIVSYKASSLATPLLPAISPRSPISGIPEDIKPPKSNLD
ncbi:MAG: hypothetical protein IPP52_17300 [Ignavibacteria bacterium]|nr:hypothetical protein [Ignavibacteria bacterium]